MAVPLNVIFDRYAQMTYGLVAIGYGPSPVVNGVAEVTGFLYADNWVFCYDMPSTGWSSCGPSVTTTWSNCVTPVVTVWTLLPGG